MSKGALWIDDALATSLMRVRLGEGGFNNKPFLMFIEADVMKQDHELTLIAFTSSSKVHCPA